MAPSCQPSWVVLCIYIDINAGFNKHHQAVPKASQYTPLLHFMIEEILNFSVRVNLGLLQHRQFGKGYSKLMCIFHHKKQIISPEKNTILPSARSERAAPCCHRNSLRNVTDAALFVHMVGTQIELGGDFIRETEGH